MSSMSSSCLAAAAAAKSGDWLALLEQHMTAGADKGKQQVLAGAGHIYFLLIFYLSCIYLIYLLYYFIFLFYSVYQTGSVGSLGWQWWHAGGARMP